MSRLWSQLNLAWTLLRTGSGADRNPRKLTVREVLRILESEVERGIADGVETSKDAADVRVKSVEVEIPLGITIDSNADRGIETDLGNGVTTTTNIDTVPGGQDGSIRVQFTPGNGSAATRPHTRTDAPETGPPDPTPEESHSGTPIETIRSLVGGPVDELLDAGIETIEDVADAGESTVAEVTTLSDTEVRKLVSFATAVRLGASQETARVLATLDHTTEDLAGLHPTALLAEMESAIDDGRADVRADYRTDVRELSLIVQEAGRVVAENS